MIRKIYMFFLASLFFFFEIVLPFEYLIHTVSSLGCYYGNNQVPTSQEHCIWPAESQRESQPEHGPQTRVFGITRNSKNQPFPSLRKEVWIGGPPSPLSKQKTRSSVPTWKTKCIRNEVQYPLTYSRSKWVWGNIYLTIWLLLIGMAPYQHF